MLKLGEIALFLMPVRSRLVIGAILDPTSIFTLPHYLLILSDWVPKDRIWAGRLPLAQTAGLVAALPFCRAGELARVALWERARLSPGYVLRSPIASYFLFIENVPTHSYRMYHLTLSSVATLLEPSEAYIRPMSRDATAKRGEDNLAIQR
jgi:hypothetical protein